MRGVHQHPSPRLPGAEPSIRGVVAARPEARAPQPEVPKPQAVAPTLMATRALDRTRVEAQNSPIPPLLAAFVAEHDFAARITDVRHSRAGVLPSERAAVRAQLQGLSTAELSALRDVLVLKPPHPDLKKLRGHPALVGRPTLEGVLSLLTGEALGIAPTRTAASRHVTNLGSASPAPSVLAPGTPVRVRRSSGELDAGWTVRSRAPNGDVIVVKPELGATKQVSAAQLLSSNRALLAPGTPVQVRRSSGAIEANWKIVGATPGSDLVRVTDGRGAFRDLTVEALVGLNAPLLGGAPLSGVAQRVFAPGASVSVTRSSGARDEGWTITGYDPQAGQVLVTKPPYLKSVEPAALLTDNPALLPPGTPVIMPRANGVHESGWTVVAAGPDGVLALGPAGEQKRASLAELLPLNPQLVQPAPETTTSGRVARVSPAARAQSESFRLQHVIPAGTPIVDGYVDGGRSASIAADGTVTASREVIVVDRQRDPQLAAHLAFARGLREVEPRARAQALLDYVDNLFTPPHGNPLLADDQLSSRFASKEVLIGEIPTLVGGGTCRHRSLMLKLLGDEAGLPIALQRGNAVFGSTSGAHAWNVIHLDGTPHIADAMNPTRSYGAVVLPAVTAPGMSQAYVDVRWQPLYGASA
jgi:hypothetical protein